MQTEKNLNGATILRKLLVDIYSFGIIQVQNTDVYPLKGINIQRCI